jgi:hypothetical protein
MKRILLITVALLAVLSQANNELVPLPEPLQGGIVEAKACKQDKQCDRGQKCGKKGFCEVDPNTPTILEGP